MDMRLPDEQAGTDWHRQVLAALMTKRGAMYSVRLPDGSIATAFGYQRGEDEIVPLALALPADVWEQIPHLTQEDVAPFRS